MPKSDFFSTFYGRLSHFSASLLFYHHRNRIGKTFLIDRFFDNQYDFTFVGAHKAKTATQTIPVNKSGVFIVNVDDATYKVAL